jgi:predicted nucleic acid-binding Zn finger protein
MAWKVPSSKDISILYEVNEDNDNWSCTCPSFAYNGGKDCKHIKDIKTSQNLVN